MDLKNKSVTIETTLGTFDYIQGRFVAFELMATGDKEEDMLLDAQISAIDQDGGEVYTIPLGNAPKEVISEAEGFIRRLFLTKEMA